MTWHNFLFRHGRVAIIEDPFAFAHTPTDRWEVLALRGAGQSLGLHSDALPGAGCDRVE